MQLLLFRVFSISPPFPSTLFRALFLLTLNVLISNTRALFKLPPNMTIPAVLVFGDSIVDTGNNNNLPTMLKCNFPPYGIDFPGRIATGRFCDGKVPSDIIAEELGLRSTLPAYSDSLLGPQDLLTGVAFASGGTGYDPMTAKLMSVIPMSDQLDHFKEYIGKLKMLVGENQTNFILANGLFLVVAGSDDIANTYFSLRARSTYSVADYTDLILNSASNFVQELFKLGARRIGVFSAPPIGCVPEQRTLSGAVNRECAEGPNQMAILFNSKLSEKLDSLSSSLPNARIVYVDVYNPLLDMFQNPTKFGFEVADKGCCGTGDLEVAVLCNQVIPVTCSNVSSHIFWDSFHPTEKAYRTIVVPQLSKYVTKFN